MRKETSSQTASSCRPDRRRRSAEPSIREVAEGIAAEGDLTALVQELVAGWSNTGFGADEKVKLVHDAIGMHAAGGPLAMADAAFLAMVRFDLQFLARAQMLVTEKLKRLDRSMGCQVSAVPKHVAEEDLERIVSIEDRILHVLSTFARIRHILALAEQATKQETKATRPNLEKPHAGKIIEFAAAAAAIRGEQA